MVTAEEIQQAESEVLAAQAQEIPVRRFRAGRNIREQQQEIIQEKEQAEERLESLKFQQRQQQAQQRFDPTEKVLRQLEREAQGKKGSILDTEDERKLRTRILEENPEIRQAVEQGVGFAKTAAGKGISAGELRTQRAFAKQAGLPPELTEKVKQQIFEAASKEGIQLLSTVDGVAAQTDQGIVLVEPTFTDDGKNIEFIPVSKPIQASIFQQPGQSGIVKTDKPFRQIFSELGGVDDRQSIAFRDDIQEDRSVRNVFEDIAQSARQKILGLTPTGAKEAELQNLEQNLVERRSEIIENLNRDVESFNLKFGDRELTKTESSAASKEKLKLDKRLAQFKKDEQKFEQFKATSEEIREGRSAPRDFEVGVLKLFGGVAAFIPGIAATTIGATVGQDPEAKRRFAQLLPFSFAASGEDFRKNVEEEKLILKQAADKPFEAAGQVFGLATLGLSIRGVEDIATQKIVKKLPVKTKITSKDLIEPMVTPEGKVFERGSFKITSDTPAQFAVVDTPIKQFGRIAGEILEASPPPFAQIGKRVSKRSLPEVVKLTDRDIRAAAGDVLSAGGEIKQGVVGTERLTGERKGALNIFEIRAKQEVFDPTRLDDLTNVQRFALEETLGRGDKGFRIIDPDATFSRGLLELDKKFSLRADATGVTLRKGKPGKNAQRFETVGSAAELDALKIEGIDLLRTELAVMDTTFPRFRRPRKAPERIKGISRVEEPIFLEGEFQFDKFRGGGPKTDVTGKTLKEISKGLDLLNIKAAERAFAKRLESQSKNIGATAASKLRKKVSGKTALSDLSRVSNLPLIVGGGGRGMTRVPSADLLKEFSSPNILTAPSAKTLIKTTPDILNRELQNLKNIDRIFEKELSKAIQKAPQKPSQRPILKPLSRQIQKPLQKVIQKPLLKPIPKTIGIPLPPSIPRTPKPRIPLRLPRGKRRAPPKRQPDRFDVAVRRFGKFRVIGKGLGLQEALALGSGRVRKRLARTFKLKPLGGGKLPDIKLGTEFRRPVSKSKIKDPLAFVELSKFALSDPTEKAEIQKARRAKPKKRKIVKKRTVRRRTRR